MMLCIFRFVPACGKIYVARRRCHCTSLRENHGHFLKQIYNIFSRSIMKSALPRVTQEMSKWSTLRANFI